jgi:putative heme iron utilization protein
MTRLLLRAIPLAQRALAACVRARAAAPRHFHAARAAAGPSKPAPSGHAPPPATPATAAAAPEDPEVAAFQVAQAAAPRLSLVEEARTLVDAAGFGVLSTLAARGDEAGFPSGSAVEFAADAAGRPIFALSSLSPHTGDLRADARASLTVLAAGFGSIADARATLTGRVAFLAGAEAAAAREAYLARHPGSFWVDFGDFAWARLEDVAAARVVGGFARAGRVAGAEYAAAAADPVARFSAPVCGHMNEDHAEATRAMVKLYAGLTVDAARMLSLDRLGVNVECTRGGEALRARLPFPRPAADRKAIKELIVEMTRAAAAAAAAGASA